MSAVGRATTNGGVPGTVQGPRAAQRTPPPPHGQWRLLAAALFCWTASAALIHVPGTARAIAVFSVVAGLVCCAVLGLPYARRQGETLHPGAAPRVRGAAAVSLVVLACLILIAVRIDAGERRRELPAELLTAGLGGGLSLEVSLSGFPAGARGFDDEPRSWVRGSIESVAWSAAPAGTSPADTAPAGPAPAGTQQMRLGGVPVILWLPEAPNPTWYPGLDVCVSGGLKRGPPEGNAAYEVSVTAVEACHSAETGLRSTGSLARGLGRGIASLRSGLRGAAAETQDAELVPGLAVGDTGLVSDEIDDLMLKANLTHLTAVSGSNCALVIAAMNVVFRAVGGGRRTRAVASVLGLGGFVLVVGPDPSVQRAAIMAAVLLASRFGGRTGQALPALGAATLALLWADPWQAIQPGFALSVSATLGILVLASQLTEWLRLRLRLPSALALPLAVAVAAQLSCAPVLLLLQPGLSLGGIVANFIASPAAPVGTGLGLAALIVLPLCGRVGSVLVELAVWPARWITAAGSVGVSLPGARLFWPEGWGGAFALSLALALIGGAIVLGRRAGLLWGKQGKQGRRGGWRGGPRGSMGWVRTAGPPRGLVGVARTLMAAGAGLMLGVTAVVPGAVRLGTPDDWIVVACDVGQGDAVMLRDPGAPGEVMLIDTGDDEEGLVACLDLFGVDRISLLVLTHNHRDHTGALESLDGRVDRAILPKESADDVDKPGEAQLRERLSRLGVPTSEGYHGMKGGSAGLSWRVLGPPERASYRDANATSLVVSAEVEGHTVLLLGDTGADEQRQLEDLEASAERPTIRADIVKVAHHGSKNQLGGFYEQLGSAIALVSVGEGNRYGHPNAELIGRLEAVGTRVLRTDERGSIAVRIRGGAPETWAAGERSAVAMATGRSAEAMSTKHIADANAPAR